MGIAILCLYTAALVHLSRRARAAGDGAAAFFVNNRAGTAGDIAFSLVVSCVGASATMGMAGQAFAVGTPAFWWLGSGAAGLFLLSLLLAEKVRESGCSTMPELVEGLAGKRARTVVSLVIVAAWTAILAAQYAAATRLVAAMTGLSAGWSLAAALVLVVAHTMGGQAAVIRVDRVQCSIMAGGLILLLYWLARVNPGWSREVRIEAVNEAFRFSDLLRYGFVIGGNYLVCPMLFGRFLSAADPATARRGGLLAAGGLVLASGLIVAIGLACRGLVGESVAPDAVLTVAVDSALPPWAALAVLLALTSAVVSSADSCLVTAATVMGNDLLRTSSTRVCRACVAALGALGLAVTLLERGILGYLFIAYDVFVAGVVMPVFVALLAGKRPGRPRLFTTAVVGGGVLGAVAAVTENPGFSYAGIAFSLLLGLAGHASGSKESRGG